MEVLSVIVALEEAKYKLTGMREPMEELGRALRVEELRAAAEDEEQQTLDPSFWNDPDRSSRILQGIKQKKTTIENYESLVNRLEDAIALAEIAIEASDEDSIPEVQSELEAIAAEAEKQSKKARL